MGNGQSSPLQTCLDAVCGDRSDCVAYKGDPFYQLSWVKPFNLDVPVTPVAVIRPDNAKDVAEAVKCAAKSDVKVQAKSGGHSYANYGLGGDDGALMVDLVNLKDFSMDEDTWYASVGAGHRLGDMDKKMHAAGKRAMAHGTCPSVGIGGHATIGGLGPMSRMWGSALDHVIEVEVVTADGKIQRASQEENSDLFFALRGAGASFGIITEFVVKTHPEPGSVVEYTFNFSFGRQKDMADVYRDWQALVGDPDMDKRFSSLFIAQPLGAVVTGTFYGTEEEFEKTGIPDKLPSGGKLEANVTDWLGSLAHEAETAALTLGDLPSSFYSKSLAFREEDLLDDDSIDALFDYMDDEKVGTLLWFIIWDSTGGVINEIKADSSAYPHRDKVFMYQSYAVGIPTLSDTTKDFLEGVHEHIQKGAPNAASTYAGYVDPAFERDEAQKLYWGDRLPELQKIKKKWDASNVFQNPQSVTPAK